VLNFDPLSLRSYTLQRRLERSMWERFSVQSTPSGSPPPHSRNYSPGPPRRSSHLAPSQRSSLGLNFGGSSVSLGLSSNASNTSLPTTSRLPNGSSLRQEHYPATNVPDPLDVLRSILGIVEPAKTQGLESSNNESRLVWPTGAEDVDFGSLSLQEYATTNKDNTTFNGGQKGATFSSTREDREKYEDFHDAIEDCDDVLKSVETYLTKFQAELGAVSAEIENLQTRSVQLNAKLENRRKVEKLLGPTVEDISLSPMVVRTISEGTVDEDFVKALKELEHRSAVIAAKGSESEPIKALEDIKPLLDDLKAKAVERIRDFVVAQIKALRSPSINAQIIQQQTFIPYKELYAFLARSNSVLAEEIGQAYVNTMKWYYNSNFTRYQMALEKLQVYTVDQHDVLGAEQATSRRNVLSGAKAPPPQHDALSLGRRADVLKGDNQAAISSYHAEENKSYHYLEVVFNNFNQALVDNVCAEYSVVTELFSTKTFQQVSRKVVEIFEPVFSLGHSITRQLVENSTDCLGVLLCVRLNQRFAFEMQRRKVPVADSYINGTNMLLWPRFQMIMDLHCESMKRVVNSTGKGAVAAFSLVSGTDASKQSVAPHAITQRFGQFVQGILALSSEAGDDEPVSNSLGRLRTEFEALMAKLSRSAGDATKRSRFLYNNYTLVLTIISDTQGKLAEEQKAHFESLLKEAKGRQS
jgi:vacuolar protein sorting-associated protein 52